MPKTFIEQWSDRNKTQLEWRETLPLHELHTGCISLSRQRIIFILPLSRTDSKNVIKNLIPVTTINYYTGCLGQSRVSLPESVSYTHLTLPAQHTTFNTWDNWAIKHPIKKEKDREQKGYRFMARNMYTIHSVTKQLLVLFYTSTNWITSS